MGFPIAFPFSVRNLSKLGGGGSSRSHTAGTGARRQPMPLGDVSFALTWAIRSRRKNKEMISLAICCMGLERTEEGAPCGWVVGRSCESHSECERQASRSARGALSLANLTGAADQSPSSSGTPRSPPPAGLGLSQNSQAESNCWPS